MRAPTGSFIAVTLLVAVLAVGCASEPCLPEPEADATPPDVRLLVTYTDPDTRQRDSVLLTNADTATVVWADPAAAVTMVYAGADPEGMRRLALGVTIEQTVGVGARTRSPVIAPIEAACPAEHLRGEHTLQGGPAERSVLAGIVAENWGGQRASTPSLTIRQRVRR